MSQIDGNRDGNRGELWRTVANVGGRSGCQRYTRRPLANYGERWRTGKYLKTTKVQAFGGSNPSPSVFGFGCATTGHTKPDGQFDGRQLLRQSFFDHPGGFSSTKRSTAGTATFGIEAPA